MPAVRKIIKSTAAKFIHYLAIDKKIGSGNGARNTPLIVCYHRVVRDFSESSRHAMPSLLVSTAMFEKQLDWLSKNYKLVSMDEVLQAVSGKASPAQKQLATITFDDGYVDFYWNAFPILKRKGIPSSVFVVTNLVGTEHLQTHDELYLLLGLAIERRTDWSTGEPLPVKLSEILNLHADAYSAARYILANVSHTEVRQLVQLMHKQLDVCPRISKELQSLTWSMLRTLSVQGVTIGSHTESHALLPRYEDAEMVKELSGSRRRLELELNMPVRYLAYPDGQFDERTAAAADAAGYEAALTICQHSSVQRPAYSIARRVLWEKSCTDTSDNFSPAIMSCMLNGVFQRPASCAQDHGIL